MRVLIVGAGVAGLTLAAKLKQQGREPVIIERSPDFVEAGYGIGLWPLGSCVLHGLGVYDEFAQRGVESRRYELADHSGRVLRRLEFSDLTRRSGPMVMLSRTDLIEVLRKACGELRIRFGTTAEKIERSGNIVRATFGDGSEDEFDLVVACDGMHSKIRGQIFPQPGIFDTGWVIWTWWGRTGLIPPDLVREYWGRGSFFGEYPVPGRCMFVAGLPADAVKDPQGAVETVRGAIEKALEKLAGRVEEVRLALKDARTLFAWPMSDIRAREWYSGRVALCGDAGAAFLPTAGIGASSAMRSAAALADELSRADAASVPSALGMYVKRCQKIVQGNQEDSRTAARFMFVQSNFWGWGRDRLVEYFPANQMIKQITKSMEHPF